MPAFDLTLADGLALLAALAVLVLPMALAWLLVRRSAGERKAQPTPPEHER
ncbi:hypothetical protein G7045_02890 [Acidovorax sp. HDW3]|uniref:hypothetical protein n=1 Tax=Acidovorax sp. HDW3 TaxID=2714923 RepID=UPI001407BF59|nr:hypothetical protein [Acidovorax sp. HDW3]QIL43302.1 hypothetical protein G7045_02890 [Acidovorax sp. HDW3]